MQSLARFSDTLKVISAAREPKITNCKAKVWGTPLVFNRLWEQQRTPEVISALSEDRRFRFEIERACFALSLQRLCEPGSDLQGSQWVHTVECAGFDQLELQHLYRVLLIDEHVRKVPLTSKEEIAAKIIDKVVQRIS